MIPSQGTHFLFGAQRFVKLKNISSVGLQNPLANRSHVIHTLYTLRKGRRHWFREPGTFYPKGHLRQKRNSRERAKSGGGEHRTWSPACHTPTCQLPFFFFFFAGSFQFLWSIFFPNCILEVSEIRISLTKILPF